MTFAEKLDRAKTGSKAAYESLCLGSVDSLYTAALIALKNGNAAEEAVRSAVEDGYAGITRIKDERHLRSWLVHELTKHIVDKLKEFKANGTAYTASGEFAATECLPDVERLVFSVAVCFGYGTRELSVLTGMSESAVAEKLAAAGTRLGAEHDNVRAAARRKSAPMWLREHYSVFTEPAPEPEPEHAPAEPALQEDPVQAEAPVRDAAPVRENDGVYSDNIPFLREIPAEAQSAANEPEEPQEPPFLREIEIPQGTASAQEDVTAEQPPQIAAESADIAATAEISYQSEPDEEDADETVFADENAELAAIPAGQSAAEKFDEDSSDENPERPALNAATFIAVVSAEQMKGSEFLRLIGNTRISNNVYREIEQNPRLTKKRLIELLEQSPLNETDYYKLLTAVKHRREVINAKEESRLIHERAGLFDGTQRSHSRRRRVREIPKTELQMAIEVDLPKKEIPLTIDEKRILEDEFDYEIKTAPTERRPRSREENSFRDDRIPIITSNQKSLGAVINEVSRSTETSGKPEPFHPSDMEGIFNNIKDIEAVDPIAAIYAKETGDQAKPRRIEDIRTEWIEDAKKQDEERARNVDNSTGTQEFDIKPPAPEKTFDTREFDASELEAAEHEAQKPGTSEDGAEEAKKTNSRHPLEFSEEINNKAPETKLSLSVDSRSDDFSGTGSVFIPAPETIASVAGFEVTPSDIGGNEPEIETVPVSSDDDISVTSIISDYSGKASSHDEHTSLPGVSDVTAILDTIPRSGGHESISPGEDSEASPAEAAGSAAPDDDGAYSPGIIPGSEKKSKPDDISDTDISEVPDTPQTEPPAQAEDAGYTPSVPDAIFETQELDTDIDEGISAFVPPPDDDDDDGEDDDDENFVSKKTASKKEKRRAADDDEGFEISAGEAGDAAYDEDSDETYGGDEDEENPHRERYKGNEYFPDDNEYYEGVNRGKIIFCAICAVLLIAGAVSMKFVFGKDKPDVQPDDKSGNAGVSDISETDPAGTSAADPVNDSEILTRLTEFEDSQSYTGPQLTSKYLRASSEPYAPFLSKSVIRTDDTLYIYNDGKIKAVYLDPDEPKVIAQTELKNREQELSAQFVGFTAYNGRLYTVTQVTGKAAENTDAAGTDDKVCVDIYTPDLNEESAYYIDGKYCGMGISGGKLVAVTYRAGYESDNLPGSSENTIKEPSDIIKLNGSETNGLAVIGEVGGSGFTVISGCIMCYPKFDGGDGFTLLCADNSQTFAVEINSSLEAVSAKRYAGRAFSEDCLSGDSFIGADMTGGKASGVVASVGKNALTTGTEGETPYAVAWTDDKKTACVLARQSDGTGMLYGFDMTGETPASADNITAGSVYSEQLIEAGGKLIGLKVEETADKERMGLRLSQYDLISGKLTESGYTVIGPDERTPRENLKYVQSPAENDPTAIAVNESAGLVAVPTIYFDGFSEVERVTVFDSTLSNAGEIVLYDEKSSVLCAAFSGSDLFVVTDSHIIVTNTSDLSAMKTFDIG